MRRIAPKGSESSLIRSTSCSSRRSPGTVEEVLLDVVLAWISASKAHPSFK